MSKSKKIESNGVDVKSLISKNPEIKLYFGDVNNEIEITVKPRLALSDRMNFSQAVADGVTSVKTTNGETSVLYATKDYLIKINTLLYFTDIEIPKSEDARYDLVYNTDIYDTIVNGAAKGFDYAAYEELLDATDAQIEFEVNKIHNQFRYETEIYLNQLKFECEQVMDSIRPIADVYSQIPEDQMSQFFQKISQMKDFSVEALVDAIASKDTAKASANATGNISVVK